METAEHRSDGRPSFQAWHPATVYVCRVSLGEAEIAITRLLAQTDENESSILPLLRCHTRMPILLAFFIYFLFLFFVSLKVVFSPPTVNIA